MPELNIFLTYGLQATGLVFLVVFMWNLICAPYRIECDAHNETKQNLLEHAGAKNGDSLSEFYHHRKKFTLKEAACILARQDISRGEVKGVAAGYLSDLESAVFKNKVKPIKPISDYIRTIHRLASHTAFSQNDTAPQLEATEISKEELEKYSTSKSLNLPNLKP